jgi:DNA polymerase elongation subunit (family B)
MSFVNVFYNTRGNKIHLWEEIEGERFYDEINWVPYVFLKTTKSDIHSIDGHPVARKDFNTHSDYYEFCKNNFENKNIYENNVRPEIQFLAEKYHEIPDDKLSVPKLRIYTIDIEVASEEGFPEAKDAKWPITLISIKDNQNKMVVTFGEKEYTGQKNKYYRHCKTETEILERFFNFVHKRPCDVYTGWNVYEFDLTYLIIRSMKLFGEGTSIYKKLSPIGIVRTWTGKKYGDLNIDIAGVHILDYMDIYKWYAPKPLEKYSLDFVAKYELGKTKLQYDYDDLKELYKNDWNTYVDYNVVDVDLVDDLEDKLGYIRLVQALSLLTKCPMKYYQAMTSLIEGALITHYRRNNMCAPIFMGGHQKSFPAAYVKEPQKGMHNWVIDIDIASSYPSHMIALNMSNETYFGRILEIPYGQMATYTKAREFPSFHMSKAGRIKEYKDKDLKKFNMALKRGLFAIAPCGSVFLTKKPGVIASVEKAVFYKRKDVKNQMKELRNEAAEMEDCPEKTEKQERAKELFALQWAIKILLNAVFGILAVPYSRYFNTNIAEAITSCGRHTILQSEKFVNEFFETDMDAKDMVAYIDTDSLFIKLGDYFEKTDADWLASDDSVKIDKILDFSVMLEEYVNERIFEETQKGDYNSQVDDFKIMFKQEIIAKSALFVKKKKYAYWVVNDEGTPADDLAVKGLEIVRSDSAEDIRVRLKHVYELIMKQAPEKELSDTLKKYQSELKNVSPEGIAANIGVNNIKKYIGTGKPIKRTPWHVRGVHNYRILLKELGIDKKYEQIHEGEKAKVVYLKPNTYDLDIMTFQKWPTEFDRYLTIDYDLMIDKFFMNKVGFLLNPMGKESLLRSKETENVFNAFFG